MIDGGLSGIFQSHLPDIHWQRVESGVGPGVPDINFCSNGIEGWIEFKFTTGWRSPIRVEQNGWLQRRSRAGGRTFVATRRKAPSGPRSPSSDALWLHRGADAQLLMQQRLNEIQPLGTWDGGPARWAWDEIRLALTK